MKITIHHKGHSLDLTGEFETMHPVGIGTAIQRRIKDLKRDVAVKEATEPKISIQ